MSSCGTKAEGSLLSSRTEQPPPRADIIFAAAVSSVLSSSESLSTLVDVYSQAKLDLERRLQKQHERKKTMILLPPPSPSSSIHNGNGSNLTRTQRDDALQSVRSRLEEMRARRQQQPKQQQQ
jgi:hypothetical protein